MADEPERNCGTCGSALDGLQRYCLSCGARAGSPSPQLAEIKRRATSPPPVPEAAAGSEPSPASIAPASGPRLPTPRISALLVLIFLGFGALLGSAAGSSRGRLAADVSPRLKLVVPASTASSTNQSSVEASEAPASESEPESTPEAGTETAAGRSRAGKEESEPAEKEEEGHAGTKEKGAAAKPATKLPSFKHVFVIVLANEPYAAVFGPESKAHYVARTLEKKGELLLRYDAVAHEQLPNGIAIISGQGPTAQTASNCPAFSTLARAGQGPDGQVLGAGCVYPAATQTVGGQLTAKRLTWRAYVEGMDEPGTAAGACAHPSAGAADGTLEAGAYATFRDPFVYFESVTSDPSCASDVVGLSALKGDLAAASKTPSLAYIVPDRCHDGGPTPCSPGAPTGPPDAQGLLEKVIPQITASEAYKSGGLIVITTDEAPSSGEYADSSSCCGQPAYPNLPALEGHGKGGGTVGALLISPFVPAAKTSAEPYNHFSLLRTIEDIFKLGHLGYAGLSSVKAFAPALFTATAKG